MQNKRLGKWQERETKSMSLIVMNTSVAETHMPLSMSSDCSNKILAQGWEMLSPRVGSYR